MPVLIQDVCMFVHWFIDGWYWYGGAKGSNTNVEDVEVVIDAVYGEEKDLVSSTQS
jgi:hypothetical protein